MWNLAIILIWQYGMRATPYQFGLVSCLISHILWRLFLGESQTWGLIKIKLDITTYWVS